MLMFKCGLWAFLSIIFTASAAVIVDKGSVKVEKGHLPIRQNKKTTSSLTKTSSKSTAKSSSTVSIKPSSTSSVKTTSSSIISSSIISSTSTSSSIASSTSLVADSSCTNGPFTRQCWGNGFSIATDYDTAWPVTGNTVSYTLEITNTTLAPDGTERLVMAINGQYPGPTLHANWGDTLSITVINNLQDNGQVTSYSFGTIFLTYHRTSMHWHGIRQMNSGIMDGTSGVTECPIPPNGGTKTYTFLLTQFGTSWYHSHYSAQYGDGVLGPIVIAGPATANYDIDLGAMPITDWWYQTAYQVASNAALLGIPPAGITALINGTMVGPDGGAYNKVTLTAGKRYRLRLINTSVNNHFRVSLDNHNLTVIQADFVPTIPYTAEWIFIAIGQRYDVIINANQAIDNYWFRAVVMTDCGANDNSAIQSIFSYVGATDTDPTSTSTTTAPQNCNDESGLTPYVVKNVTSTNFLAESQELDVLLDVGVSSSGALITVWNVNSSAINVDWTDPTLSYVAAGNTSYPTDLNLIQLPTANTLHFWIIQAIAGQIATVPHPIHLHGHDFYLLGSGTGNFTGVVDPSTLQFTNPPRRDVAMLPAGGWLVIAFETNNPGAWLLHCHISWHLGEGLAVQFLERASEIPSTFALGGLESECAAWDSYYATAYWKKDDSGI